MARKRWLVVVAGGAAIGLSAATAYSVLVPNAGGTMVRRDIRTETVFNTYTGAFNPLPNAVINVAVPPNQTRLITAQFSAESGCTGAANQWCAVRIMAKDTNTGAVVELHPQVGADFHYDSVAADLTEAHSMTRTIRLGSGAYLVYVERATSAAGVVFRLDDWTFMVDTNS